MKTIEMFGGQKHGEFCEVQNHIAWCGERPGEYYDIYDDFAIAQGGERPLLRDQFQIQIRKTAESVWMDRPMHVCNYLTSALSSCVALEKQGCYAARARRRKIT